MIWKIRSQQKTDTRGRPKYWSGEVGWTWKTDADAFTDADKEQVLLPKGGVWEAQQE